MAKYRKAEIHRPPVITSPHPAQKLAAPDRAVRTLTKTIAAEKDHHANPSALPLDPNRLIRLPEILAILPIKKSTFWLWVKQQKAPAPIRLGRCACWRYADIIAMTNPSQG